MSFDLRAFAPTDEGAVMEIKGPGGGDVLVANGKPLWIKYASADSQRWKRTEQAATNRRIDDAVARGGRVKVTAQQQMTDRITNVVAVTLEWSDNMVLDGEPLACNAENAKKLYATFPFIFEQGEAWCVNRENFLKGGDDI